MANVLPKTDGGLITARNSAVVFIDDQPRMTFGVADIGRQLLLNNVVMPGTGAKEFGVPARERERAFRIRTKNEEDHLLICTWQ